MSPRSSWTVRVASGLTRWRRRSPTQPCAPGDLLYRCNICELLQTVPIDSLCRDEPSCSGCGSTARWRSVVDALIWELEGRSMTLPALATDRSIQGLGVGDWPGYADVLSTKMAYSNTFFERQPHLDIHAVDQSLDNRFDFVIASDVLEHVAPPVSAALSNLNKILKPGGFLLLTVPYQRDGQTVEHFPALHDYKIEDREGEKVLVNLTADGSRQEYRDLVFHGGYGETLELRLFSAPGLKEELARAGFDEVKVRDCPNFEFGIYWGDGLSYPVVARKGAKGSQYGSAL